MTIHSKLAVNGGLKVRNKSMPSRFAFGVMERKMIEEVMIYYDSLGVDPGYEGFFEKKYCQEFADYMGGGYVDAVSTGTASLYVAIRALNLPIGSSVLVSPVTDPGTISAIILNGLKPKLVDVEKQSYNISLSEIEARISKDVSCLLVVHAAGKAISDIEEIADYAKLHNVYLIEDCSQAHGALVSGQKVGTFGDIACFSTMYRKASISGSSGGVVFTKNEELYQRMLAHADRGKPRWKKDFDDRNPAQYLFPALNFNTDEISCAIGIASIGRLEEVRMRRVMFLKKLVSELSSSSKCCNPSVCSENDSPFYFPIFVKMEQVSVSKFDFANAILHEGIPLSVQYNYLVVDWPWVKNYLADSFYTVNARNVVDSSFNLYLNENYGNQELRDIVEAIVKVENAYFR